MIQAFVPGKLTNPMNGSHGHWTKHRRWARSWREKTALALLEAGWRADGTACGPKDVLFTAYVGAEWDDDNIRAAIKPVRDALIDCGVIHSDKPSANHAFAYRQVIDRHRDGHRGVMVVVTRREETTR